MVNSHHMYIEKLSKEYMEVFNTISKYVTASNMDEMRTEETLSEVMDTFLAAQEAGKPVEKVVGKDLQKFCESLCSEKGIKTYILGFFEACHFMFIWYFLAVLLDIHFLFTSLLEGEKINFFTFRSYKDMSSFLITGIFVLVLLYSINYLKKKFMFTNPKLSKWLMPISFIFIAAVCIIIASALPDEGSENGPYLWISLIICGVYLIFRRIITKDKRRFKKENCITFNEFLGVSETFKNDTEEMEMIRFEKMNKMRVGMAIAACSLAFGGLNAAEWRLTALTPEYILVQADGSADENKVFLADERYRNIDSRMQDWQIRRLYRASSRHFRVRLKL